MKLRDIINARIEQYKTVQYSATAGSVVADANVRINELEKLLEDIDKKDQMEQKLVKAAEQLSVILHNLESRGASLSRGEDRRWAEATDTIQQWYEMNK